VPHRSPITQKLQYEGRAKEETYQGKESRRKLLCRPEVVNGSKDHIWDGTTHKEQHPVPACGARRSEKGVGTILDEKGGKKDDEINVNSDKEDGT